MGKENIREFLLELLKKADFILLEEQDKFEALRMLVEQTSQKAPLGNRREFLQKIMSREKMISTGIGNRVAIPHAHCDEVKDYFMTLGYSAKGIEFDSMDQIPVNLLVLIGTPGKDPERKTYLKILSEISKMIKNTKDVSLMNSKEKFLEMLINTPV